MSKQHNYPVGIMASGSGTTFEAFCHSIAANNLPMEVRTLIVDRPGAGSFKMAERINRTLGWDIRAVLIDSGLFEGGPGPNKWDLTDEQSTAMTKVFDDEGVVMGSLQGFLSRVRGDLFQAYGALPEHSSIYQARLLNTHPAIPSLTRGLHGAGAHRGTRKTLMDHTEQTLHVVSENYDEGSIYARNRVAILPDDTWEDTERAVQATEKQRIAPDTLRFLQEQEEYLREHPGN